MWYIIPPWSFGHYIHQYTFKYTIKHTTSLLSIQCKHCFYPDNIILSNYVAFITQSSYLAENVSKKPYTTLKIYINNLYDNFVGILNCINLQRSAYTCSTPCLSFNRKRFPSLFTKKERSFSVAATVAALWENLIVSTWKRVSGLAVRTCCTNEMSWRLRSALTERSMLLEGMEELQLINRQRKQLLSQHNSLQTV